MSKIFLLNIGANLQHQRNARSPIFDDGSFVYVPFSLPGEVGTYPYPSDAWNFTNGLEWYETHADPDWEHLTYGDNFYGGRGANLRFAEPGDILLFWSLLWHNVGDSWIDFTGKYEWYLIGAIRIGEILSNGDRSQDASTPKNRERAYLNAHFGKERLLGKEVVFIADERHSCQFDYAVPLVNKLTKSSLMYRTFRAADGSPLPLNGKHWSGYARTCRVICDLGTKDGSRRAKILRDSIRDLNDFDLTAGTQGK